MIFAIKARKAKAVRLENRVVRRRHVRVLALIFSAFMSYVSIDAFVFFSSNPNGTPSYLSYLGLFAASIGIFVSLWMLASTVISVFVYNKRVISRYASRVAKLSKT